MDKRVAEALTEISSEPVNPSRCWTKFLPDSALELLHAIEELNRDGRRVNRRVAAAKFNELYGPFEKPVTQGQVENHLNRIAGKGCACWKDRDYL